MVGAWHDDQRCWELKTMTPSWNTMYPQIKRLISAVVVRCNGRIELPRGVYTVFWRVHVKTQMSLNFVAWVNGAEQLRNRIEYV